MSLQKRLRLDHLHAIEWLIIAAGAGLCLCVTAAAYLSHQSRAQEIHATFQNHSRESSRMLQLLVRDVLISVDDALKAMKRHHETHGRIQDLEGLLGNFSDIQAYITVAAIANEQGFLVTGVPQFKPGTSIAQRSHFKDQVNSVNDGVAVGIPLTGQTTGLRSFHMSRRLNKPDGSFAGIASIGFSVDRLESVLKLAELTESRGIALVGTDGILRARAGHFTGIETTPPDWRALTGHSTAVTPASPPREDWIVHPIASYPLVLAVRINHELMRARVQASARWHQLGAALLVALILVTTAVITRQSRRQRRDHESALRAEHARRHSEERFQTIFEKAPLGISLRPLGRRDLPFLKVNRQFSAFLGYSADELLTKSLIDINDAEEELLSAPLEQRLLNGELQSYSREKLFRRMDGSQVWGQVVTTALRFDDDSPPLALSIILDLQARKDAELALRESEERYRELFENHPIPALIREENTLCILDANRAACAFYGYARDTLKTMRTDQLQSAATRARYLESVAARPRNVSDNHRRTHVNHAGDEFEVEVFTCPLQMFGRPVRFIVVHDITEQQRNLQLLQESEHRLRFISDEISEGIALYDRDDRLVFFNKAYETMQTMPDLTPGLRFADIIRRQGEKLRAVGLIDDIDTFVQQRLAHHARGSDDAFERQRSDGGYHLIRETRTPDGQTIITFTDITEQKKREVALAESEERFRAIFLNAGIGITMRVLDSRKRPWEMVNDYFCEMTGYTREELLNTVTTEDITLPDYNESAESRNRQLITGEANNLLREKRIRRKDGETIWVQVSLTVLRQMAGEDRVIATYRNINDRKLAEENLHTAEQRMLDAIAAERNLLRTIIDNIPDHIQVKDGDLRFVLTNAAWRAARPHAASGELGRRADDMLPSEQAADLEKEDRAVLASGNPLVIRESLRQTAQGARWFLITKLPLRNPEGTVIGVVGIGRDITDFKMKALDIARLNDSLEQRVEERTYQLKNANEELEAFSSSVSHDLRAPVRNIDGMAALLMEDCQERIGADGLRMIQRIRDAAKRMAMLIDDLLRLSRVSRDAINHEPVDLTRMAQAIIEELRQEQPHHPGLRVSIAPGMRAQADPGMLRSALHNLLGNAWKFTRHAADPAIEMGVSWHMGHAIFHVRDNGAGFEKQYAGKLFGAFQRLHDEKEFPGTGVGLATVRRIMRRHGGDVWADAVKGRGAVFFFTLTGREIAERLQQDETLLPQAGYLPPTGTRILVVDDDADALALAERAFRREGFDVQTAEDAKSALKILETRGADIIVSDYSMPGMNGAQLLQRIQTLYPDTHRVILSSQEVNADMAAGLKSGAIHQCFQKSLSFDPVIDYFRDIAQKSG